MTERTTQALNHDSGKAQTQIILDAYLVVDITERCQSNNDVKVSVIPNFTRWWQLFTIKRSAVSTLELTVITSALPTEQN